MKSRPCSVLRTVVADLFGLVVLVSIEISPWRRLYYAVADMSKTRKK